NAEIDRQSGIRTANDSYIPRWLRGGGSVDKYNVADMELQNLLGAKEELVMFREEVRRYNERDPVFGTAAASVPDARGTGRTARDFTDGGAVMTREPASSEAPKKAAILPSRVARTITLS